MVVHDAAEAPPSDVPDPLKKNLSTYERDKRANMAHFLFWRNVFSL